MATSRISEFLDYYEKVRQRTLKVIACIPPEKFDWTCREGKFTFADIIRHLAAIERYMYAENVQGRPSRYPGHDKELADGPENVLRFFETRHQESMAIFSRLTDSDLDRKCVTQVALPSQLGNGCARWSSMRFIIARRFMCISGCSASQRRLFTGSRRKK